MSQEELMCASLDNLSLNQESQKHTNSNTSIRDTKNADDSQMHKDSIEEDPLRREPYFEDIMSQSYSEISLEQDLPSTRRKHRKSPVKSAKEDVDRVECEENREDSEVGEEFDEDVMTGSYGEISLDKELDRNDDSQNSSRIDDLKQEPKEEAIAKLPVEKKRPDSLVLSPSSLPTDQSKRVHKFQQTSEQCTTSGELSPSSEEFAERSLGHVRTGSDTSGLSELQGTLAMDGDMVTYVAEDLQEKIKMSSPISRWPDGSFPGSRASTPSLYRQALQPGHHIVDPTVISDLEIHTRKVASSVDTMLENLSGTLQSISSLTVDCMETYESSVCKTCDSVDVNIKAVYQLMARCEELGNSMTPLYKMSGDIKHIKKMLDQLENAVEHKS